MRSAEEDRQHVVPGMDQVLRMEGSQHTATGAAGEVQHDYRFILLTTTANELF